MAGPRAGMWRQYKPAHRASPWGKAITWGNRKQPDKTVSGHKHGAQNPKKSPEVLRSKGVFLKKGMKGYCIFNSDSIFYALQQFCNPRTVASKGLGKLVFLTLITGNILQVLLLLLVK